MKPSSTSGHHTAKPAADPKSKSHWVTTDQSYAGTGSAELTNWARAVCLLSTTKDEGHFRLILAKRGKRAGATSLEGDRTNVIHLKHSDDGILWEQTPLPVVMEKAKKEPKAKAAPAPKAAPKRKATKKQISAIRSKATSKQIEDLDGFIARITEPMNKKQIQELAEKHGHGSGYLVKKQWSEIEPRLVRTNGRRFLKNYPLSHYATTRAKGKNKNKTTHAP